MNLGQAKLATVSDSDAAVGRAVGCSKQTVARWRLGVKKPGHEARVLLEQRYQIDRNAWDRLDPLDNPAIVTEPVVTPTNVASAPPPPTVASPPVLPAAAEPEAYTEPPIPLDQPGAARALIEAQIHRLRAERQRAAALSVDIASMLRLEAAEKAAALDLARMSGELGPADETRLCKTNRWKAIEDAIDHALRPYPEARDAVSTALRAVDNK